MHTEEFFDMLKRTGFDTFTGVPCSYMKSLINIATNAQMYIPVANEGDSIAQAVGYEIGSCGNRHCAVLMQNSGLGNAISPLTSLAHTFRVAVLSIVSLRGGSDDEPQHELMGQITLNMIDTMHFKYIVIDSETEMIKIESFVRENAEKNLPYFICVKKGTFSKVNLESSVTIYSNSYSNVLRSPFSFEPEICLTDARYKMLKVINKAAPNAYKFATTGMTGRELFDIDDSPKNLYMVGSMGCVSQLAFGFSKAIGHKSPVIAIDGDGAFMMRAGAHASVAKYAENFMHIVIDNGVYSTTGGQSTDLYGVDFIKLAESMRYNTIIEAYSTGDIREHVKNWYAGNIPGSVFMHVSITDNDGGELKIGRPDITPEQVKLRMMTDVMLIGEIE
jgi:phosphonopyruvate decarboxylase